MTVYNNCLVNLLSEINNSMIEVPNEVYLQKTITKFASFYFSISTAHRVLNFVVYVNINIIG